MIQLLLSFFSKINQNLYKNFNLRENFPVDINKFQINDKKEQFPAKIDQN